LKQANKAQENYDHLAGIMKEKNAVRDALIKENSEAKSTIELLTPQTKAAWTAHAKWDAALHPPTTTTKKHPKHKSHGHKSKEVADKHKKRHSHDSEKKEPEGRKESDEDDDMGIDDADLEEISA